MNLGVVAAIVYGILAIVGGIIGYVKSRSLPSIISGVALGILLLFGGWIDLQGQTWGLVLAATITAFLVIFFAVRFSQTRKLMPAGLMALLGVVALALMVLQLRG